MQKRVNSVLKHFVLICHYEEDNVGELKIGREGGLGGSFQLGFVLLLPPVTNLFFMDL